MSLPFLVAQILVHGGCTIRGVMRRVLIVDDDVAIRVLLDRVLSRASYEVEAVRDGVEAIDRLSKNRYCAIVLDLMMPRLDGIGVVKYPTEHDPETLKNVIVLTAFGATALPKVCPPVERFLEKPFDVETLMREVSATTLARSSLDSE